MCVGCSIIDIIMKRSDEQGVGLIIQGYFRASERGARQQQQKIVRIAQIYAKQGWQRRLVHQTYSIFKKLLKRENVASLTKRLLAVWDELLESQVRRGSGTGYRGALSEIIVESYTFIFPLILEYRCLDLILDLKLYRMLWAKYITDQSFFQLRTQIAKISRNFDLNKGLTPENIDKIRKRFASKGVSQEEIQNYMGVTQLERRSDPSPSAQRKIERMRESSEDDESDALRKKVKPDTINQQQYSRVNYDGYNPEKYMYVQQQPFPVPQGSSYMPRSNIPQGNLPPNYAPPPVSNKNIYPPYSRQYGGTFQPPPQNQQNPYQMVPGVSSAGQGFYSQPKNVHFGSYSDYNSGYLPNYPQQTFSTQVPSFPAPSQPSGYMAQQQAAYPNYPNASTLYPPVAKMPPQTDFSLNPRELKRQSPQFTQKMGRSPMQGQAQYYVQVHESAAAKNELRGTSPEPLQAERADKSRYRQLLAGLKRGLSECRQCGVHFLSRQNLEQHKREHFNEAQRKFQAKQSQQIGSSLGIQRQRPKNRQSFDMMCTPSEWVDGGSSSEAEAVYQVSIKRLPPLQRVNPVFNCYFCNEDMEVNWCAQLQEWTLSNGVKVYEQERGLCVAHFDCYQCFRSEDAAFRSAAQTVS